MIEGFGPRALVGPPQKKSPRRIFFERFADSPTAEMIARTGSPRMRTAWDEIHGQPMNPSILPLMFVRRLALFVALALGLSSSAFADIPTNLKPVGLGLGGFSYYSSGPFANTALTGGGWIEFSGSQWGTAVPFYDTNGVANPQFNDKGLPKYLVSGMSLRLLLWPYAVNASNLPASWPARGGTGVGKWVVTWTGNADVRLNGATFVSGESSGAATGSLLNGRRVYQVSAAQVGGHITVNAVTTELTDLKVWLPDPANPSQSLETSGQFWHPTFLAQVAEMDHAFLRFMDWGDTNASPVRDWVDRRLPRFAVQGGLLNRRSPAPGVANRPGDRPTGMAYEYMVALANATNKDLWICVPHLATDTFVTNLANLIRYGSNGVNPYTSTQTNPVHPPLNSNLRVWVEYSNEIWSSGNSFAQGDWAQAQATAQGITKPQFNARRAAKVWSLFQQRFGGAQRLVRVAAIFTGSDSYTTSFLTEARDHGATLSPAVTVDVVSPTTYFGNGIQDWVYEQANLTRGTAEQWFHTAQDFVFNTSTGATRPVSVPLTASEPYWTSAELAAQQIATFAEWRRRIFSGSTMQGGGPDSTGTGGGFSTTLRDNIFTIFGQRLPIVAYEGGPSLYTDYVDGGDARDDGLTNFMIALNRRPEFAEIYRVQLNMAKSKGLATHGLFVDVSRYGKYGQWGHREYPGQPLNEAVKAKAVADWATDIAGVRSIDSPIGTRPSFVTPGTLPIGQYLTPYSQDVEVTGGNYTSGANPQFAVIGKQLAPGLTLSPVSGQPSRYRVSGTPQEGGWNYFYLRVKDSDGDAAWQIYSFYIAGGPSVIVEADLRGAFSGAGALPKTTTLALSPSVTWSGINRGAAYAAGGGSAIGTDGRGVDVFADTDGIRFGVSQGTSTSASSTLASAITDNEYWKVVVTPVPGTPLNLRKAEFQLTWMREQYHAPRYLAVMTSVGGFTEPAAVYTLASTPAAESVSEVVFRLPDTAAYGALTTPVEFRIYVYGSQYSHKARLLGFKLSRHLATPPFVPGYELALASDFTGSNPGQNLPWTATSTLASDLVFSGWTKGAGITGMAGNDQLRVHQNMPAAEASATLALAIADNEYLEFTLSPQSGTMDLRAADISFTVLRAEFHAPRRFAVFTSVGGFTTGAAVYDTGRFTATTAQTFTFQLPDTSAYNNLSGPVQVRIYGYSGQYLGHDFALEDFELSLFRTSPY